MTVVEQSIEKLGGECQKGKMTNDNFLSHPITRISHVLELVDTNGLGTMKTVINVGARFMLTFVNEYLRFVVVYFMRHNSDLT